MTIGCRSGKSSQRGMIIILVVVLKMMMREPMLCPYYMLDALSA